MKCLAGVVSLLAAALAHAVEPAARPADLEKIAELAQSVAPEFKADALLRVVESGRVADPKWKRELIGQAFESASTASAPNVTRVAAGTARTRQATLDRISLQARALTAMSELDRKAARSLFAQIVKPVPRRLSCDDTTWDDVSAYYSAAARVAAGFDAKERKDRDAVNFAAGVIGGISSAVEIGSAQPLLAFPPWRQDEKELLAAKYAAVFDSAAVDSRSYPAVRPGLEQLPSKLAAAGYDGALLQSAFGRLDAKYNALERCPGAPAGGSTSPSGSIAGQAAQALPDDTPEAQRIRAHWMKLMYGEKDTTAWKDELAAYLDDIEKVPDDFKAEAFEGLMIALPAGSNRELVQARYLAAIQNSPLQASDRLRWFESVKRLIDSARTLPPDQGSALLARLEATGHPVLALYSTLERIIPAPAAFAIGSY